MEASLFYELGMLFIIAAVLAIFAVLLRQPLVLAYILTGVLVSSGAFASFTLPESFQSFARLGVALLLFTVGLGLNWRSMREIGVRVLVLGAGQIIFTTTLGYFVGRFVGFAEGTALFLALAFAFSSTIMVVKFLADREELDTLHGRLIVGVLLIQDVVAMFVLLLLSAPEALRTFWVIPVAQGIGVLLFVVAASMWLLPAIVRFCARSSELQLLLSLGWCFAIASILHTIGFGVEMGALVAGVSLSGTGFGASLSSRIRPLRDFFLVLFFIMLGASVDPQTLGNLGVAVWTFSAFLLIGNPLIVTLLSRVLGFHAHTGWLTGAPLGQVSEFSFILISAGIAYGMIPPQTLTIVASVGLLTMTLSTFVMEHDELLYRFLRPFLSFGSRNGRERSSFKKSRPVRIFLLGADRMGERLLPSLHLLRHRLQIIDINPGVVERLKRRGLQVVYGDLSDHVFLENLGLEHAKLIVSTIPDVVTELSLLEFLRAHRFSGVFLARALSSKDSHVLMRAGADYTLVPPMVAGSVLAQQIQTLRFSKKKWRATHFSHV